MIINFILLFYSHKNKVVFLIFIILVSCVVNGRYLDIKDNKRVTIVTQKNIIVFPPVLQYESIIDDSYLSPAKYKGKEVTLFLERFSAQILNEKGFNIINTKTISKKNILFKNAYKYTLKNRIHLFNPIFNDSIVNKIKEIGEYSNNSNILVFFLKVKVDSKPGALLEHGGGLISSVEGYTRLKAVLIDTKEGLRLWENEIQLREIPAIKSSNFKLAINFLFKNLKKY